MLSVTYADCHIQALYVECRYADCRGATPSPSIENLIGRFSLNSTTQSQVAN